jgi:Pvc16 N-terminal domain
MALAPSSLSQVCKGIRQYLDSELNGPARSKVTVVLATPSDTASASTGDSEHRLNLFFFRFEPAGFFPDTLPGETGWLRTFCLVTPFAAGEDTVGAGENDLRLVGEAIRIFQEKPVFLLHVDDQDYHLQVVFQPLGLDQLNQLWSTQGDTIYRPSALYEVSLAPVIPQKPAIASPLAGGIGFEARATMERQAAAVAASAPEVHAMKPAIALEDWAPAIAFVDEHICALSLAFALGSGKLATFKPHVWIAGKPGEPIALRWETWDSALGWQRVEPPVAATVSSPTIDPEAAAGATTVALDLPFTDHVGQMLLYAERSYTRSSDGAVLSVRSNALLISLFAG